MLIELQFGCILLAYDDDDDDDDDVDFHELFVCQWFVMKFRDGRSDSCASKLCVYLRISYYRSQLTTAYNQPTNIHIHTRTHTHSHEHIVR